MAEPAKPVAHVSNQQVNRNWPHTADFVRRSLTCETLLQSENPADRVDFLSAH